MSVFRVHRAAAADVAAVSELVEASEAALYGESTFTPEDLGAEWTEIDLERDARVVRDGDRVVGYAVVRERGATQRVEGYVHPEALGRGAGTLIARSLEEDAVRAGARKLQNVVLEADTAARELLGALGYDAVRVFREMRITLAGAPPAPVWPDGLHVEPFVPERDARDVHAANEEAFADHWGHTARTFDAWSRLHLRSERFDPELWCILRSGGEIAAATICTGETYGGGFVHVLFTRRPWRGRGVGTSLLHDAFGRFWARGEPNVGLSVDAASETGAFRLYERAGMTPALGWVMFEKQMPSLPSRTGPEPTSPQSRP
jgi:mycothiol synthase